MNISAAHYCRQQGWLVGTIFQYESEEGAARFLITAIGERTILYRQVSSVNWGFSWSLHEHSMEWSAHAFINTPKRVYSYTD